MCNHDDLERRGFADRPWLVLSLAVQLVGGKDGRDIDGSERDRDGRRESCLIYGGINIEWVGVREAIALRRHGLRLTAWWERKE